jgi:hypothetical protein
MTLSVSMHLELFCVKIDHHTIVLCYSVVMKK